MSPPDAASLEKFSLAELWNAVRALISELMRLRADNAALQARAEAQEAAFAALKVETQALRDEVARLKGLPPRPPSRPSGMERSTGDGAGAGKARRKPQRRRGAKRDRGAVTSALVVKASPPPGSRFKGYEDLLVRELRLSAELVRLRRERWVTPSGETVLAPLPAGIVGGFGPGLRRFLLVAHAQGQVTTERLVALLAGIGIEISKRQVVRLLTSRLDDLVAEDRDVLRAGLATARWVTVDDTAARHARRDGVTTQIGDDRFTAFRTGGSKSREAFLSNLRAGHGGYMISEAALAYMRDRALAGPVVDLLAADPVKVFADEAAWKAHLAALGIDRLAVTPDPVRIATEGALWGAIKAHGLLPETVIVSDDAGQFRVGEHALCWVHAERLVHKLVPTTEEQRRAIELTRTLIWWFYADLKAWKRDPCPRRAAALRARFDRIFTRRTALRDARPAAGAPAPAQGRAAARARAPGDPAAHQRLRERHPRLRHQAQGQRRHHERGRAHRPRRPARPDEDLPQARRLVLPLPRRSATGRRRPARPAAARPHPPGRFSSLTNSHARELPR